MWKDYSKMDLGDVIWVGGGGCMDCIYLAESRDRWWEPVNVVMNLQVP